MPKIVVTVDGPAGAGKSTISRMLAERLGYQLLDTGALYRAVALAARRKGVSWDDGPALGALAAALDVDFRMEGMKNRVLMGGEDVSAAVREPDISEGASRVSALPEVRQALLELQRRMGASGGVVVEGRDAGTVVFPDAAAKFFLTAAPDVRAHRRWIELNAAGMDIDETTVLADMIVRDHRDETRTTAPLRQAPDALRVDSTHLSPEEVVSEMEHMIRARENGG
ncbi:MAG TPA: (d)CMP kinase [Haliangiales bacterium]|nr:(d)CMP kinase [Haliangiales bacterium]